MLVPKGNPKRSRVAGYLVRAHEATLRRETFPARALLWQRQFEERTWRLRYAQIVSQQGVRLGELVSAIDAMGVLSKRQRVEEQTVLEQSGEAPPRLIAWSERRRPLLPNVWHHRPSKHSRVNCLVETSNPGTRCNHRRARLSFFSIERADFCFAPALSEDAEAGLMQIMVPSCQVTWLHLNTRPTKPLRKDPDSGYHIFRDVSKISFRVGKVFDCSIALLSGHRPLSGRACNGDAK